MSALFKRLLSKLWTNLWRVWLANLRVAQASFGYPCFAHPCLQRAEQLLA
jgi:hypothetical protein